MSNGQLLPESKVVHVPDADFSTAPNIYHCYLIALHFWLEKSILMVHYSDIGLDGSKNKT